MSEESTGKARGGHARAEVLSPDERTQIAQKAAAARWGEAKTQKATHLGEFTIGERNIACAVLEDGTRVLSQKAVAAALGRSRGGLYQPKFRADGEGEKLPFYINAANLRQFISKDLLRVLSHPIPYRDFRGGTNARGIPAIALPQICDVWLRAREAGVLSAPQKIVAQRAEMLMRVLAQVAIIALVDEATGYQAVRPRDALQQYLDKLISKELAAWVKTFPDEFYENIYKLKNWPWPGMGKNRYSVVAQYTNDLVYERLAPGLRKELEAKNPRNAKGYRPAKNFQWLTSEIGHPMLAQHLYSLMMFQRLAIAQSFGWNRFVKMVDQVHPKKGTTLDLPFGELDEVELSEGSSQTQKQLR